MKRVGILGGTFDPPHLGHLRAGEVARQALSLERVLYIPAADPPHKQNDGVTDASHRVRMIELALADEPGFDVSRVEVDRSGPSYTIDTMEVLQSELPDARFYFIMGSDTFREIRTWRKWENFLSSYSIVVQRRPEVPDLPVVDDAPSGPLRDVLTDRPELSGRMIAVAPDAIAHEEEGIFVLQSAMLSVSSTAIRESVGRGGSIRFLVPDPVAAYVEHHHLYEKEG